MRDEKSCDSSVNYFVYLVKDKHRVRPKNEVQNVRRCRGSLRQKKKSFGTSKRRWSDRRRFFVNYIKPLLPWQTPWDIIGKPLISIQGSLHARSFCQGNTGESPKVVEEEPPPSASRRILSTLPPPRNT